VHRCSCNPPALAPCTEISSAAAAGTTGLFPALVMNLHSTQKWFVSTRDSRGERKGRKERKGKERRGEEKKTHIQVGRAKVTSFFSAVLNTEHGRWSRLLGWL